MNANNEMLVTNLMISMQSNKQKDSHIAYNYCVAVEYFTYFVSELFIFVGEMPRIPDTIDVFLNNFQYKISCGY